MIVVAAENAAEQTSEAIEVAAYHLQQSDVDGLFTAITGLTTLQWFSLLAQLVTIGVVLVVIIVIAIRRV